jgi:predicted alpha/beta-fold hydrolase
MTFKFSGFFKPLPVHKLKMVKKYYMWLFKGVVSISLISLFGFCFYRQIPRFNTYEFVCQNNSKNEFIINSLLPIDYIPTIYLPSCFLQMVYNETKSAPNIIYKRQYLKMPDEGVISLDWVVKTQPSKGDVNKDNYDDEKFNKLLVILHGLTGGSEGTYIREIVEEFMKFPNLQILVVNYRGISNSPLLTPHFYHAGYTEDMYRALLYIKENFPSVRCYAMGTSMGANIITKLLAKHDDFNDYIKGFICISNPLNCFEVEKRNRGGVLDLFLIKRQKNYIERNRNIFTGLIGMIFINFKRF